MTVNKAEVREGARGSRLCSSLIYKKALALLEKCKIETRRSGQKIPELEAAT